MKWIAVPVVCALLAIYFVLQSKNALVTHPKGLIARSELKLIAINVALMLIILVPTLVLLLITAWKYRAQHKKTYQPKATHNGLTQVILWLIPSVIVVVMAIITWDATHKLDPYRPIDSQVKAMKIQVVAIDWKWLFIYPEQQIATLNYVRFPEKTPIHFELAADGSPMNSFWLPELSGQIYCMAGMVTPLHIMADGPGVYRGRAAEINGEGYASMVFTAESTGSLEFEKWVQQVRQSPLKLDDKSYEKLLERNINKQVIHYSHVEDGNFFETIVMKYMPHHHHHTHR